MVESPGGLHRRAAIVGVGSTKQGAHPGVSRYRLGIEAVREALADAAIDKSEIDAVLTGQQFDGSGLHALTLARLLGVEPLVTNTLDYSTGGFTTQYAAMLVATGVCRVVLCAYARNPAGAMHELSGAIVEDREYGLFNAGATAALGWTQYRERYDVDEEVLGHVAVAARDHARLNPNAAFTEPLTLDDYLAEPQVLWPLRELDICKVTAGAAAVLVTTPERAREGPHRPVLFESVGRRQAPRRLEVEGHLLCAPMRDVAKQAFAGAGLGPADVDVLGVSDASTVAIVQTLEHYGFCGDGEARDFVAAGNIRLGGTIPVNPDGGQLSGGYLVGWLHQVELARQLRGVAGDRQVAGAEVAMYTTTGTFREQYAATIYTAG